MKLSDAPSSFSQISPTVWKDLPLPRHTNDSDRRLRNIFTNWLLQTDHETLSAPMIRYFFERLMERYQMHIIIIIITIQYNTIQYNIKTYNAPYVTKMLFVGAEMTRD